MKSASRAVLLAACLAVPTFAPPAFAQMMLNEDGLPINDPNANAVFVRDSGVASERLALAERLERQKEWNKSADVYGEVMQKFADRVVPSKKDKDGKPTQYISAARLVQDRIAAWPTEGLDAYRRRFEDVAREQLNGDDPAAPTKVADGYFVTDAGRDAAIKVMSQAFEAGDFTTAAGMGKRLLDLHPGLGAERPAVLLRTGIAEHFAGRGTDAKARLDELQQKFPDALAKVAGVDTRAADALAGALNMPIETIGFRSDDWPSAFGTADASAVPDQVSTGGARLFGVELPTALPRAGAGGNLKTYKNVVERDRKQGLSTGILPSVDGGTLFFQDNARVYAYSLASGLPLPGWQQSYANSPKSAFAVDAIPMPRGKQLAVSVTPQSVVALVGQVDLSAVQQLNYPLTPPQIVCLDRTTGKRLWSQQPQKLKVPDELANLRDGVFYGTPVVDGDTVYALVNANRNGQFEECHVVALRLSDGSFKWATYVASTSLGSRFFGDEFEGSFTTGTPATLSMSAGRLFVSTGLGAIACLESTSGNVRWLDLYPRNPGAAAERRIASLQARLASGKPYLNTPPVVADGRVFVMPNDGGSVFVFDADDGSLVRELPKKLDPDTRKFPPATTILAVIGDKLVLSNKATVFLIPWQTFDPMKSLIANGGRYKTFPAGKSDTAADASDSIRGRPFVTQDAVYVPTSARLYRVSLKTFNIESEYPQQGDWDEAESTGNILATPENLIIAGSQQVSVYADLKAATAKLDARINADPGDVDAYLRYAELLFAAGQLNDALAKLDLAAEKLGGINALMPGPSRDRLFEIAIAFSGKLAKDDSELRAADAGVRTGGRRRAVAAAAGAVSPRPRRRLPHREDDGRGSRAAPGDPRAAGLAHGGRRREGDRHQRRRRGRGRHRRADSRPRRRRLRRLRRTGRQAAGGRASGRQARPGRPARHRRRVPARQGHARRHDAGRRHLRSRRPAASGDANAASPAEARPLERPPPGDAAGTRAELPHFAEPGRHRPRAAAAGEGARPDGDAGEAAQTARRRAAGRPDRRRRRRCARRLRADGANAVAADARAVGRREPARPAGRRRGRRGRRAHQAASRPGPQ
ncbi:MAG: PQQ-binding-like beta-propeller repeat protein [Tepidisphaeraceae bacterium]